MLPIEGRVALGFEAVRDAFAANFDLHDDVGAACCVYVDGRPTDRHPPPMNAIVSCVPGPRERLCWSGGRLESLFSVGPIIEGAGLNVTAWTYADRLNVGVLACPRHVPDPHEIGDSLAEELRLLGRSARRRRPRPAAAGPSPRATRLGDSRA